MAAGIIAMPVEHHDVLLPPKAAIDGQPPELRASLRALTERVAAAAR